MQARGFSLPWKRLLWVLPLAGLVLWQRALVWQTASQLLLGMLVSLAALPLMKLFEKRLSPGLAASCSMTSLSVALIGLLLLLVPPMVVQFRQIVGMLPGLYAQANEQVQRLQEWLSQNGVTVDEGMKSSLLGKGEQLLSGAAMGVAGWLQNLMGSLGKWALAPLFAFYFLRDRHLIGDWLLSLMPVGKRRLTVTILKEMRRESAGYIRGQLMVSGVVGGLTAVGLLLCGVPGWLLLGAAMGLLELIPYLGPFLGGVLVFLFSWQGGWSRLLWAMGVVILVQQLEGGMISPQLMSDATRLHPVAVVLCVMIGGRAAGVAGILLAVPLMLCARAALRVISLFGSEPRPEERC